MTDLIARMRGTGLVGMAKLDDRPDEVEVLTVDVLQANITPQVLPVGTAHRSATTGGCLTSNAQGFLSLRTRRG